MKVLLKVVIDENDQVEIHSNFDSNLATLGFLEIIKSVLIAKSEMINNKEELEEDGISFPIININTQA
jgi:hypothetical protein